MDNELHNRLKKRGWSEDDLTRVDHYLKADDKKHRHIKHHMRHFSFWTLLLGIVVMNIIMSFFAIPFFLFLQGPIMYVSAVLLGMLVGMFFNYLVVELEGIEEEHHIIMILLVPLLGFIDLILINSILARLAPLLTQGFAYDIAVLTFVISFLFPYVAYHIYTRRL